MKKQELFDAVLGYLGSTMDATETELHFSNPFELVIAVVLSAQCTDKRINMVTPRLFQDFPTPEAGMVVLAKTCNRICSGLKSKISLYKSILL